MRKLLTQKYARANIEAEKECYRTATVRLSL